MADGWKNHNKSKWDSHDYGQKSQASSSWNQNWWHHKNNDRKDDALENTKMMESKSLHESGETALKSAKGKKRNGPEDPREDEPQSTWKVWSQTTGNEPLDIDGNRVEREDIKLVQQPPDFTSTQNQAMWLVVEEPIPESYNMPWLRPATQLSQELEAQFQSRQGLRRCEIHHTNARGQILTSFYEHDLRNHPWVQRKFKDEARRDPISVKEIHRVVLS
jgi:hypothetical protein